MYGRCSGGLDSNGRCSCIRVIARLGLFQAEHGTKRCNDHMIRLSDPLGPAGEPGSLINGCVERRMGATEVHEGEKNAKNLIFICFHFSLHHQSDQYQARFRIGMFVIHNCVMTEVSEH